MTISRTLLALGFLVALGWASTARAQECVSCWTTACPDLKSYFEPCPPPKKKPATKPRPSKVSVSFSSVPAGAHVTVDGKATCTTPCRAQVDPGSRRVQMNLTRHETWSETRRLTGNDTVSATLTPRFGWLTVQTSPTGLGVRIDDVFAGTGPVWSKELDAGVHSVSLDSRCHGSAFQSVRVVAGEQRTVTLEASARQVPVDVSASDPKGPLTGGEVRVDGELLGLVPGRYQVPLCARAVAVRMPDGRRWEGTLTLSADAPNQVRALLPAPVEKPSGGLLTIETEPPGLPVAVDGSLEGRSPIRDLRLTKGAHLVTVAGDGCRLPVERTVTIEDGGREHLMLTPVMKTGRVDVKALSEDGEDLVARVLVDGVVVGPAPGTYDVSECAKQIEMVAARDPSERWSAPLSVTEGETRTIVATLVNPNRPPPPSEPSAWSFAMRLGTGSQTGIVGTGLEVRWAAVGLHVGYGGYLTGGLTFGAPRNRGGWYLDLHAATGNPRKLWLDEDAPDELGVGATFGWDFRPLQWLSIRIGAGAAWNRANGPDWAKRLLLVDGQIGIVL